MYLQGEKRVLSYMTSSNIEICIYKGHINTMSINYWWVKPIPENKLIRANHELHISWILILQFIKKIWGHQRHLQQSCHRLTNVFSTSWVSKWLHCRDNIQIISSRVTSAMNILWINNPMSHMLRDAAFCTREEKWFISSWMHLSVSSP